MRCDDRWISFDTFVFFRFVVFFFFLCIYMSTDYYWSYRLFRAYHAVEDWHDQSYCQSIPFALSMSRKCEFLFRTHQCSRQRNILTWHVLLVISFHSINIMTDVTVLENKSDWILSLLFFFFFFFLACLFLPYFNRFSFMFDIGNHH